MDLKKYRPDLETLPAERFAGEHDVMCANLGSFALVLHYLWHEWGIDPTTFPDEIRGKTYTKIRKLILNMSVIATSEKMLEWLWAQGMQRWR